MKYRAPSREAFLLKRLDRQASRGENLADVSISYVKLYISLVILFLAGGCGTTYGIYHQVSKGETLYAIGRAYGVSHTEIMEINGFEHDIIFPGQHVFIPDAERRRYVAGSVEETPATGEVKVVAAPKPKKKVAPAERVVTAPQPPPREARVRTEDLEAATPAKPAPGSFLWPVKGVLYSKYGMRDGLKHDGIDISAPEGTPVVAAADGRVIYSGDGVSGYGNLIIVKHEGHFATVYAHNKENLVAKGDFVSAGQLIARVGQTGRASGPHLHFELRKNSKPIDPGSHLK